MSTHTEPKKRYYSKQIKAIQSTWRMQAAIEARRSLEVQKLSNNLGAVQRKKLGKLDAAYEVHQVLCCCCILATHLLTLHPNACINTFCCCMLMHAPKPSAVALCCNAQCLLLLHHEARTGHCLLSTLAALHWTCITSSCLPKQTEIEVSVDSCDDISHCIRWHAVIPQCCHCSCLHVSCVLDIAEKAADIRGLLPAALTSLTVLYMCVKSTLSCHCLQLSVHLVLHVHIGSSCDSQKKVFG